MPGRNHPETRPPSRHPGPGRSRGAAMNQGFPRSTSHEHGNADHRPSGGSGNVSATGCLTRKVHVKNAHPQSKELPAGIKEFMHNVQGCLHCEIRKDPTGKPWCAIATYESRERAEEAVRRFDHEFFRGTRLSVSHESEASRMMSPSLYPDVDYRPSTPLATIQSRDHRSIVTQRVPTGRPVFDAAGKALQSDQQMRPGQFYFEALQRPTNAASWS
ncbi:MAG: hypothetical protein M1828_003054 [Chrysothrix sp. TS-e1954]|nr:MAG: hypothetical protein M1828_003054 [Chrysothrix sp. TS-e1954]